VSQLEEDYYERWVPSYVTAIATDECISCPSTDRTYHLELTARVCVCVVQPSQAAAARVAAAGAGAADGLHVLPRHRADPAGVQGRLDRGGSDAVALLAHSRRGTTVLRPAG